MNNRSIFGLGSSWGGALDIYDDLLYGNLRIIIKDNLEVRYSNK